MATATVTSEQKIAFGGVTPILRVSNLAASIDYYTRTLGFKVNWGFPDSGESYFASVSRGKCSLFLSVGDQGHPGSWVWIGVPDVELIHEELKATGARIRQVPTNYPWALEMQVEDPDGNVLRIGSEPRADKPTGEWLDMNGVRWAPLPDGGWKRVERE